MTAKTARTAQPEVPTMSSVVEGTGPIQLDTATVVAWQDVLARWSDATYSARWGELDSRQRTRFFFIYTRCLSDDEAMRITALLLGSAAAERRAEVGKREAAAAKTARDEAIDDAYHARSDRDLARREAEQLRGQVLRQQAEAADLTRRYNEQAEALAAAQSRIASLEAAVMAQAEQMGRLKADADAARHKHASLLNTLQMVVDGEL